MLSPATLHDLAMTGVHISVSADKRSPDTLKDVVLTVTGTGGHVTLRDTDRLSPQTLQELAVVGRGHLTLEV